MKGTAFEWHQLPLHGPRLVEASAGTGKTWAIAALYVRLLLGDGNAETRHPRGPLSVRDLLVVTFTIAATNELRDRIRSMIRGLRSDRELLSPLRIDEGGWARLELALTELDEARIYTIHGFCQQVLRSFPVECAVPWQWDYVIDDSDLWRQVVNDFWRREVLPLGRGSDESERVAAHLIGKWWSTPSALRRAIDQLRIRPGVVLEGGDESPQTALAGLLDAAAELARYWREEDVRARLVNASALRAGKEKAGRTEVQDQFDRFAGTGLTAVEDPEPFFAAFASGAIGPGGTGLKKSGEPCTDRGFLERVDRTLERLVALRASVLRRGFEFSIAAAAEARAVTRELAPDDLVESLHRALGGPYGARLAARIRALWPAVMIDEFQDTDPLQTGIFERIWAPGNDLLRLGIGDPKQSIFGFRGADLYSYVAARERLPGDARYTMTINWRSSAALIEALNTLYGDHERPFVDEQVEYVPVVPSRDAPADDGRAALRFLNVEPPARRNQSGEANDRLARASAAATADLVARGVSAGNIALIVRDRHQAEIVRSALAEVGLRAVYLSREPVLGTREARDVLRILAAMREPDAERLRAALASGVFEYDLDALPALLADDVRFAELRDRWRTYLPLWREAGVLAALHRCLREHGAIARLLARADGPRRVTDVRHIAELLEEQSRLVPSPIGLQRWLAAAIEEGQTENEARQLRLESDEGLVRVVTIHGAKGLEFDYVLLPFAGRGSGSSSSRDVVIFHRPSGPVGFDLVASLAPGDDERSRAEVEDRAEEARLLYVALTRARRGCVVGVCNMGKAFAQSSLGYLLFGAQREALDDTAVQARLEALAQASGGRIAVEQIPAVEEVPSEAVDRPPELPIGREFTGRVNRSWRVSSYSALVDAAAPSREVPGLADEHGDAGDAALPPRDVAAAFPRGPNVGVALHELFEAWPDDAGTLRERVRRIVAGSGQVDVEAALGWLQRARSTPLPPLSVSLAELDATSRELEFHLSVRQGRTARVRQILEAAGMNAAPLGQAELTGLLRGFIDLVFYHEGRFYLADYKSNWLGPEASYYDQGRMRAAMREHRYDLQLMIYAAAVRRHLRACGGDDLAARYAGAFYLFLRGMDGSGERGVWFEPADTELLDAFDAALG